MALALLGLLPSGCGNNPYPAGESAQAVLYRTLSDDPKTLDPGVSYEVSEAPIVDLLYPSYFRYHYLKRDPYALELSLGAREPVREPYRYTIVENGAAVARTGERWTFRIKPGLRFQDDPCFPGGRGREIVAADILFAFRRMADPAVSCPVLSFFEERVLGLHAYAEHNRKRAGEGKGADWDMPVAGLQADPKDPYTFRILLSEPYPQLRYLMAMHFTAPMAREAVERYGAELARHPVGCGTYVLTEYAPKQRLVLRENPNRPDERYPVDGGAGAAESGLLRDAGSPLPLTPKIVFNVNRESITSWNLFLQGYLDTAGVTKDNFNQAISPGGRLSPEMQRQGIRMRKSVGTNVWYFAFNMGDPVVGGYTPEKRKLRQAITLAIDSEAIIDLYRQGNGVKAEFLFPPGIYGYDPAFRNPYRSHDLARAKRLLAEAGYPDGISRKTGDRLEIYNDNIATTAAERQFVGLMTKQLNEIGVRVISRSWRSNVYRERVLKNQFQFIRYSWYADYPDPENFVFLLYGPNRHPGPNHSGYDNPEYNRLFEKMRSLPDGPERLALIRQLRAIAVEDCPLIFLWHDVTLSLHHDWLGNVEPNPIAYDTLKYIRVDAARRARRQEAWNRPNYAPLAALAAVLVAGTLPAAGIIRRRRRRRVRRVAGGEG